jgi:3-hydroxyacyl-CoA dehydrogenase
VDYALRYAFGMALGPFEMSDLAGNDIGYNIRKERGWVRSEGTNSNDVVSQRPCRYTELADDMVSQLQRFGQKVGKGWYNYDSKIGNGRKPLPSNEMSTFVQKYIVPTPTSSIWNQQVTLSDQDILERVLYPLVNEGFKCLEDQIVRSPSDIDVIYLYGYGFPIWRGGPMYWADHMITLPILLDRLQEFHTRYPNTDHYVPSQLLIQCVQHNMTLEEYWKRRRPEVVVDGSKCRAKL